MKNYIEKPLNYDRLKDKKFTSRIPAFTLAEVLITLAIIGIVAALTIPTVITNNQTKQFEVARKKFESQMIQIASKMNLDGQLSGTTTENFVQRLKKYAKIMRVCTLGNYTDCFPETFKTEGKKTKYSINSLTLPRHIGLNDDYNRNTAIVFADGSSIVMSFNTNCNISPFDNSVRTVTSCFHGIVDTNGKKGPNIIGKDIFTYNAAIAGSDKQLFLASAMNLGDILISGPTCSINQSEPDMEFCGYGYEYIPRQEDSYAYDLCEFDLEGNYYNSGVMGRSCTFLDMIR